MAALLRRLLDDDLLRGAMGSGGEGEDATETYLHSTYVDEVHESGRRRIFYVNAGYLNYFNWATVIW